MEERERRRMTSEETIESVQKFLSEHGKLTYGQLRSLTGLPVIIHAVDEMEYEGIIAVDRSAHPYIVRLANPEEANAPHIGSTGESNPQPLSKEVIERQINEYLKSAPKFFETWGMEGGTVEWRRTILMEYIPFIIKFCESNKIELGGDGKIHDFIYRKTEQTPENYTIRDVPKTLAKIAYARRFLMIYDFIETDNVYNLTPTKKLSRLEKIMFS